MKDKLEAARRALAAACERRDAAYKALEDAPDTTSEEDLDALTATFDEAQAEVERHNDRVGGIERIMRARDATPLHAVAPAESEEPAPDDGGDGGEESLRFAQVKGQKTEQVYQPMGQFSFFRDIISAKSGRPEAQERLWRHQRQAEAERRDLTTVATDGGGFAPPNYLQSLWAGLPRQGRPFADVLPTMGLPPTGVSFSLPRITTGATTAVTSTENAAVNEVDLVEEVITRTLVTCAGMQDLSMQLFERSDPAIDQIIFNDLRADYDNDLDVGLLGGAGTSGTHLGIRAVTGVNTVTYTDASPTAAELVPKIYDAIQKVQTTRYLPADTIVMHPRRAAWLASNLSSTFPLFQLGTLTQAAGTQDEGMLRSFSGLRVVLDANIGTTYGAATNEDEIYVLRAADAVLMEGPVVSRVLSEVGSGTLTVRLQVYGFSMFFGGRYPASISVISGTGLVSPTF